MQAIYSGHELHDSEGHSLGKITDVINDPVTIEPRFVTVKTGRFHGEHLLPVEVLRPDGEGFVVPFHKNDINSAPTAKNHTAPTTAELDSIYEHYHLESPPAGHH